MTMLKQFTKELLPKEEELTASTISVDVTPPQDTQDSSPLPVYIKSDEYITLSPDEKPDLFGTIITNESKSALIQDRVSKQTGVYSVNDEVAGFTVSEIREDAVVLTKNDKFVEIRLREYKDIPPLNEEVAYSEPAHVPSREAHKYLEDLPADTQLDW